MDAIEENVSLFLTESARERNWDLSALSKEQRRELLWDLKARGSLKSGSAQAIVSRLIGISKEELRNFSLVMEEIPK
jgi:predicted transcriptional regulator YheO